MMMKMDAREEYVMQVMVRFGYYPGKEEKSLLAKRAGISFTASSCVYIELFVMETLNWNEVGRVLIRSPLALMRFKFFNAVSVSVYDALAFLHFDFGYF